MSRALWFAAGAGAGLYGALKARRLAYRASPSGLADQAGALRQGALALVDDVRTAARRREAELAEDLGLSPHNPPAPEPAAGQASGAPGTAHVVPLTRHAVRAVRAVRKDVR